MPAVETLQVSTSKELDSFIDLPWRIYAGNPYWVPPLKKMIRRLLDPKLHPFWRFSERVLFLALRDGRPVGRIAGIIDHNYNSFHNAGMGVWGFFECENDPEAAIALFDRVQEWVCRRGMTFLRGPLNPSINYEIGLLSEGFDKPPTFMMPYTHPYYLDLVESAGFHKEKELKSFFVDRSWAPPDWMMKLGERVEARSGVHVRNADKKNLARDVALIKHIFDEAWKENWGFVPMTDEETQEMTVNLVKIADPDLAFFIFVKDEPVGVGLAVPDINPLLKRLNGRIGLLGPLKYLLYRKEIRGIRGLLFGIKEGYRQLGLPFVGLKHIMASVRKSDKYDFLELGWNLEDNEAINQLEVEGGARPYKRYRIYRKTFGDRW
jgi:hypothetical protein